MATDAVTRAEKMADKAVRGFKKAHTKLVKANELLDADAEEKRLAAIEWRKQVEEAIANAERAQKQAIVLRDKNASKINMLSDLIS